MPNRWISVFKTFLQIHECKAYLQNGWRCSKQVLLLKVKTPCCRSGRLERSRFCLLFPTASALKPSTNDVADAWSPPLSSLAPAAAHPTPAAAHANRTRPREPDPPSRRAPHTQSRAQPDLTRFERRVVASRRVVSLWFRRLWRWRPLASSTSTRPRHGAPEASTASRSWSRSARAPTGNPPPLPSHPP